MSYCSHCGSPNKASSKFCNNCGALLTEAFDIRCAICGSANKPDGVLCSTCGGHLEAGPAVLTDRVDTIAPIPNPPPSPRVAQVQIAGANEEKDTGAPSPDLQGFGRRMPEWTMRLRPSQLPRPSPPPTPPPELEGEVPPWLHELRSGEGLVGGGEADFERFGDWLAKLRAAAVIEPEPTKEDSAASAENTEPTPIPQWFANIRPPVLASPPEPSSSTAEGSKQESAGRPEEEYGYSRGESRVGTDPTTAKNQLDASAEALPEWLVQLQSTPLPTEKDLTETVLAEAASTPAPISEEKLKGSQDLPAWLNALAAEGSEQEAIDTVQVAMTPSPAMETEQPPAINSESKVGLEMPLTPEEESVLPDWLAAPIEPEALLAELEETRAESPARESESQEEKVPIAANMPPSRLARVVDDMQAWLQALWRNTFRTSLQQVSPENGKRSLGELPASLTEKPVVASRVAEAPPQPVSHEEDSDQRARPSEERARLIEVTAEPPGHEMLVPWPLPEDFSFEQPVVADEILGPPVAEVLAAWPLPEDFSLEQPVVVDEILEPHVPEDAAVSQAISKSTNEQPAIERRVADQAIVEEKINVLTVPTHPAL